MISFDPCYDFFLVRVSVFGNFVKSPRLKCMGSRNAKDMPTGQKRVKENQTLFNHLKNNVLNHNNLKNIFVFFGLVLNI